MAWCFYLINHINLFRSTWSVTFAYFNNISNFQFRIFFIILFTRVNICAWLYINRFNSNYALICIFVFITLSSNLSIYTSSAITHFSLTDFPSLCVGHSFISLFCKTDFIDLLQNSLPLSIHLLLGFRLDSFKIVWKALVIVVLF